MKTTNPASFLAHLSALLFLSLPLHALAEWVTMKDCRLVPSEGNDGDSFHFQFEGEEFIARLYFVDTPESEMDSQVEDRIAEQAAHFGISEEQVLRRGIEAKEFTKKTLARPFTVVTRFQNAMGRSKLPRHYCFVFPNGSRRDLGTLLTEAGLTRSFGQTAQNDLRLDRDHYDKLEAKARRDGMGIFGGRKPTTASQEPDSERVSLESAPEVPPEAPPSPPVDLTASLTDALIADLQASNDALLRAVAGDGVGRTEASTGEAININTASLVELEALPGIGDATARRIVENRPYSGVEDLRRVPRLGEAAIKRLAPLVEF
jgi:endonuclease YncB( thermonuclease family)